jgi:hypothetical protein
MTKISNPGRTISKPTGVLSFIIWALFGNADDGIAPADYLPGKPYWWRAVCWWFRNPLHNLFFYVLGVADKPTTAYGRDPTTSFMTRGWNWAVVNYRWLWLPFLSFRGGPIRCYIGWRPPEGAFGLKLQHNS